MSQFCAVFTYDNYTDYYEFYLDLTSESEDRDKDILINFLMDIKRRQNDPEFDIYEYEEQLKTLTINELLD